MSARAFIDALARSGHRDYPSTDHISKDRLHIARRGFLDTQLNERLQSGVRFSIEITELGLVLGSSTRLARMTRDKMGVPRLACAEDRDRGKRPSLISVWHKRTFRSSPIIMMPIVCFLPRRGFEWLTAAAGDKKANLT